MDLKSAQHLTYGGMAWFVRALRGLISAEDGRRGQEVRCELPAPTPARLPALAAGQRLQPTTYSRRQAHNATVESSPAPTAERAYCASYYEKPFEVAPPRFPRICNGGLADSA